MGLDTSHGCWSGPYSSFMRWRQEVARAAGVPLMLMEGFYVPGSSYGDPPKESMEWAAPRDGGPLCMSHHGPVLHGWIERIADWLPITWESLRLDPIHVLLSHSDCDGEIAAADCGPLADRLEELLPALPDGPAWHRGDSAKGKAEQFSAGLRKAAAAGEPVIFG